MSLPAFSANQASFPEMYEQWLVAPLFRPWAELTLSELNVSPGDRVLDIACGTGIVARLASEKLGPEGRVVGIDLSPDMLSVGRQLAPQIDWRQGNAANLPVDGDQFDVVICQQGFQFFGDKPAAAAQMRRVLAPAGRLAVSTWRPEDENPFFADLRAVAERHLGPIHDARHSFGDANQLEGLLRNAGLHDVQSRTVSRTIRFTLDTPFVRMNAMALVGMSAAGKEMSPEERKRIAGAVAAESGPALQRYTDESGIVFDLVSNLATAKG